MRKILLSTHSRIPVHYGSDKNQVAGVFLVKWLITLNPEDATPVRDLLLTPEQRADTQLDPCVALRRT